jgi:ribose/xylose/arabinose/galactoside ABC-type transport system permease subunit
MADDYDFQGLMSAFAGAFFGAIIGAIIGGIIYAILGLLNIDSTIKLVIAAACIIIGMVYLAVHEYNKHGRKKQA